MNKDLHISQIVVVVASQETQQENQCTAAIQAEAGQGRHGQENREDSVLQTSRAWKMSLKPRVQMSARETSAYSHSLHALNRIPASVQESRA